MKPDEEAWFVMRAIYRSETAMADKLISAGMNVFLPMEQRIEQRNGVNRRIESPVLSGVVFVKSTMQELKPILELNSRLQYTYRRGSTAHDPLVVPERQMNDFIRAVETAEHPLYLTPDELDLRAGAKVRMIDGPLKGVEGTFQRVKGRRSRRLVVTIPSMLSVAVEVQPDFVEVVK